MPKRDTPDDRLVQKMRRGDEDALCEIIDRYSAYVGAVVWNIVGGALDASDGAEIVTMVFYTLWKNADRVRPGRLKGYLSSIARSRALEALRGAGREVSLEEDILEPELPGPEDEVQRREEYAALRRALESLPEPDYTIFIRHYYLYQSTYEIARVMELSVNTVQSKLRRGRQALRRELEKGGYFIG